MKRWLITKLTTKKTLPLEISITGGGEPAYNWNFFEHTILTIEKRCAENKIPLSLKMTTNGILNDMQRGFIATHFSQIMVSYDGLPELQNKNRNSKLYPKTAEITEKTIEFFKENNAQFNIRTTIWQDDCYHLKKMVDNIFGKFGTSMKWSIFPVIPTGRALNRIWREYDILKKQNFVDYYLEALEYANSKYGDISMSTPLFSNHLTSLYCSGLAHNCTCPWLLPNKDIITCIDSSNSKTVIGKIKNNKVKYFDKCSDPLLRISLKKFTECRECIAYRFCRGGCPAKHLMAIEHKNEMSNWECEMIQKYWIYVFRKILSGEKCFGWEAAPVDIDGINKYNVLKLQQVDVKTDEIK